MVIDPSTPLGVLRLRCGDLSDIPWLPDSVYTQTLTDSNNNIPRTAKTCAQYILAQLAFKTHRKVGLQLEVFSKEAFDSYRQFLIMTIKDPAFMDITFLPYGSSLSNDTQSPLTQFISDWNRNYYTGTQTQLLALDADISPNDNSRYGPYSLQGWDFVLSNGGTV